MNPNDERLGTSEPDGIASSAGSPLIVVRVDGSASGRDAVAWACREAGRRGARVRILAGRDGPHADADASMIVVGSASFLRMADLADGSTAMALAVHASVPVVVVRPGACDVAAGPAVGRVVVGVDGTELSEAAIDFGLAEARDRRCGVTLVHAVADDGRRADAESMLTALGAGCADLRVVVSADLASRALIAESAGARLLVVGSRGRGGLGGMLLGSVSQAVVHRAHCPVAVVRARSVTHRARRGARRL